MTAFRNLPTIGREIYFEGVPELNIVPCAACHGPTAEGIRNIPRLAGLSYAYLKRRLEQWGEGYHAAATFGYGHRHSVVRKGH
jgi:cytochrome c553